MPASQRPRPIALRIELLDIAPLIWRRVLVSNHDVGGPPGYALFLESLKDREHEQHDDMIRWIGGVFDPKGFDLNRLNREWRGAKKGGR